MGKHLVVSELAVSDKPSERAIHDELSRILESFIFGQSDRLGRFLRFTVEKTLAGESKTLKEYLIGTEVYERQPLYDPSNDSIVRGEARRLRAKLKEYYESIGRNDSIFIYYRPGSYVPVFKKQESNNTASNRKDGAADALFTEGRGVKVAVLPFVDTSQGELSGAYAKVITDELLHGLVRTDGLRVTATSSVAPLIAQNLDIPALARKLDVQVFFEGTVRDDNDHLRVTSNVVNADGFRLWSERFETTRDPHGVFEISEKIVSAFLSRIRPEQSLIRKQKAAAGPSLLAAYSSVLAAEALLDEGTLEDTESALSKFEQITEIEPEYARAFCGIAKCHCEMAVRGIPNSPSAVSRATRAATHAAKLDPQMRLVPACMACALALAWRWRDAEKNFQGRLVLVITLMHFVNMLFCSGHLGVSTRAGVS
jgi:TolB-like protein